jgi:hypothetical protein
MIMRKLALYVLLSPVVIAMIVVTGVASAQSPKERVDELIEAAANHARLLQESLVPLSKALDEAITSPQVAEERMNGLQKAANAALAGIDDGSAITKQLDDFQSLAKKEQDNAKTKYKETNDSFWLDSANFWDRQISDVAVIRRDFIKERERTRSLLNFLDVNREKVRQMAVQGKYAEARESLKSVLAQLQTMNTNLQDLANNIKDKLRPGT